MKDSISFNISETELLEQKIEKLKNLLSKSGIEILYSNKSVTFNYDTNDIERKTTRYAGRKRTEGNQQYVTVGDIKEYSKTMTHKEIYEMLHISKSTFIRRKKEAEFKSDTDLFLF